MEQNNKLKLEEKINILNGVIAVLKKDFASEDVEDKINFLSIVSGNLMELSEKA